MKSKILYLNDVHFGVSSGELSHTVGFLNALSEYKEINFITHRSNKPILSSRGLSEHVNLIFIPKVGIKSIEKILYFIVAILFLKGSDLVYIRESFFGFLSFTFVKFKPVIYEFNGVRKDEELNVFRKLIISSVDRILMFNYRHALKNIAVSKGIAKKLEDQYGLDSVIAIENGTDVKPLMRQTTKQGAIEIVFIGNLAHWQDLSGLCSLVAAEEQKFREHNVKFSIYGEGTELHVLKTFVKANGIEDIFCLKGFLDKSLIPEILSKSSLGLLVDKRFYKNEFLFSPLKYYEYRACGLPSIFYSNKEIKSSHDFIYFAGDDEFLLTVLELAQKETDYMKRTWRTVVREILALL